MYLMKLVLLLEIICRILLQKDQQEQLKYLYFYGDLVKAKENLKETENIYRNC